MKVLFIGNSHTYFNDMPHLFSDMCRKAGEAETDVTMIAYSGRTLAWHEDVYKRQIVYYFKYMAGSLLVKRERLFHS